MHSRRDSVARNGEGPCFRGRATNEIAERLHKEESGALRFSHYPKSAGAHGDVPAGNEESPDRKESRCTHYRCHTDNRDVRKQRGHDESLQEGEKPVEITLLLRRVLITHCRRIVN